MREFADGRAVNLLCPACHASLPAAADAVVTCPSCAAEVDVTRAGTIAGRPRFVAEVDRAGTTVGDYRIEARLGGGGMGTVYRAIDAAGGKVALKFLSPTLANSPEIVARFAREITTLARLEHPGIVRVLGHGTADGIPWFAMELVEGSDLRTRMTTGTLSPAETAAVFGRLFAALAHAHERGVIHRDLKPANVLLAPDGARLADFGIARWDAETLAGATAVTRLTETAAVIGTLPYMSPEQRRGGAVDRRSDLFSAGVMLYEAATGSLPQGAFTLPSEINRAYGKAFDRVVLRLLQSDPERRPTAAPNAATALAAALGPVRRRRLLVAASVAAMVVALLGAGLGGRALLQKAIGGKNRLAKNELARSIVVLPRQPFDGGASDTQVDPGAEQQAQAAAVEASSLDSLILDNNGALSRSKQKAVSAKFSKTSTPSKTSNTFKPSKSLAKSTNATSPLKSSVTKSGKGGKSKVFDDPDFLPKN